VTLKNLGNAPLLVDTVSIRGSDAAAFAVASEACRGATLEPGDGCDVAVTFAPTAEHAAAATLAYTTNADATVEVSLGGAGTAPHAAFDVGTLDFGSFALGEGGRRAVEARNDGTAPLQLGGLRIAGDASGAFGFDAAACARALPTGGTCRIVVTFVAGEIGASSATLELPAGGGASVSLLGTATKAPEKAAPADEAPSVEARPAVPDAAPPTEEPPAESAAAPPRTG
jgi:hypothetical protein